jgi:multidrug efflux pump subunit AcrA (membrane-fusion protein)
MVHAVARVENPYARGDEPNRPPLAAGLFVEAEIEGRTVSEVAVLPRSAVRGEDQVLIVSDDERLHFRTVEILRRARDEVIVTAGLSDGERVCISPLAVVTDGMRVRTAEDAS